MKNRDLTPKEIAEIRLNYPPGTRIHLNHMEDKWAVPDGTHGEVVSTDDAGQIHMKWDNGRTLALVPQVDSFRRLTSEEIQAEQQAVENPTQHMEEQSL